MALRNVRPPFDVLYTAGDSYSDFNNLAGALTPGQELFQRFGYGRSITNLQGDIDGDGIDDGQAYIETAVDAFGVAQISVNEAFANAEARGELTLEASLSGVVGPGGVTLLDFALAEALFPPSALATDINLTAQVDRILADYAARGRPQSAAANIFIGGNDFAEAFGLAQDLVADGELSVFDLLSLLPEFGRTIAETTESVAANARRLVEAGIEEIVYVTYPLDDLPVFLLAGPTGEQVAGPVTDLLNGSVSLALEMLEFDPALNARVEIVDVAALFEEIRADPANFGITNYDQPFYLRATPNPVQTSPGEFELVPLLNPLYPDDLVPGDDRSAFFDSVHPTANTHDIIAAFYSASLLDHVEFLDEGDNRRGEAFGRRDQAVFASQGDDYIDLDLGRDTIFGGAGDDTLRGGRAADILAGGSGDDVIDGGQEVSLFGAVLVRSGRDVLNGNDGDDTLRGGAQADALFDGIGSDRVRGDDGNDLFVHLDEALLGGEADDFDIFGGGKGFDTLVLVLPDAAEQALVIDAVEAARRPNGLARIDIEPLGLSLRGFERVVVLDQRARPTEVVTDTPLASRLEVADYWGVALPERAGFDLSQAIYDSETVLA